MISVLDIRPALPQDIDSIWKIIHPVMEKGDTYTFSPDSSKTKIMDYWMGEDKKTYVALVGEMIIGTFFIKDNNPDLGAHIANAGYIVAPFAQGLGLGRQLGVWSLGEAKKLGYSAMQFNFVVKANERAVKLWTSLGFEIIGEVPNAFQHARLGFVNAYIMYRPL